MTVYLYYKHNYYTMLREELSTVIVDMVQCMEEMLPFLNGSDQWWKTNETRQG